MGIGYNSFGHRTKGSDMNDEIDYSDYTDYADASDATEDW